jgi:hypothetical protein
LVAAGIVSCGGGNQSSQNTGGASQSTATPTFSPAPGSYASAQNVTIGDATTGATIYYTTDGTTPTTSSAVYSGAIPVSATETIKAIAVAAGYSNSAAASATYIIAITATPTFSLASGTYVGTQTVTIGDSTTGATIYYTTDGKTPTTSSTVYSGPISITTTETLNAIATFAGYCASVAASASYYIIPPGVPTVILNTPAAGASQLSGYAYNVNPATTEVVIYVLTNMWWVQPFADAPFTNINADGSWTSYTHPWDNIVVLLVNPANYTPAATEITNPALDPGVLASTEYPAGPASLQFSGYTWGIKTTGNVAGDQFDPGPNFWSNDPSVVNLASDGLHLKITEIDGMWQCGEVYLTQSLGYGTYTVQVGSHLDQLGQNTVAAPLFIYAATNQELDNEYSGTGGLIASPYNAQFVVQPYTVAGNIVHYTQPSTAQFTSQMVWSADKVIFSAWNGWSSAPAAGDMIYQWTYTGSYIPPPGQERVHINLWLLNGSPPVRGVGDEMIINSFTFKP